MKRITCVVAAILLLIFVVRGVIFPIVNHAGGGSSKDAETVNVQANTAGTSTDNSTEDASASSDSGSSDSSGDSSSDNSSTDATVMPVKGSAAADKLSVMTPGWHEDSTGKWYQNPDGTYYINGFAEIDGTTYSFDENGYMQTGWVEKGVKDYYFNEDGSYDPTQKRPMIALTFDDGPGEYTETLLDTVEKYNIHVTFFMLGQNVEGRESTVQRMVQLGCEIGNHTWDHPSQTLPNMDLDSVVQEFQKTDDELVKACGQAATVCRAPYGAITEEQMAAVGKPFFMWSTDSLDWKLMDADADYNEIMNSDLSDGSIILMHDIHEPSVQAALKLIPDLTAQGYKLVTVSELAEAKNVTLQNTTYSQFWDSQLEAGNVPGYNGSTSSDESTDGTSDSSDVSDGSEDAQDVSDGSDSSDSSDESGDSSDGGDSGDGSSDDGSSDDGSYDDGSSDDGSYDDSSYDDGSSDDGSYDDSGYSDEDSSGDDSYDTGYE